MSVQRLVLLLMTLLIFVLLLTACNTAAEPPSTQPTNGALTQSTPDLSQCGDEYSRPLSSSSYVPEDAKLDSNTVYTPTINITRADYEAALTKWKSQNVFEYEIAVDSVAFMGGGNSILHVTGNEVKVLGYFKDEPIVQITPESREASKFDMENTVEGLFKHVDSILMHGICPLRGAMAFPVDYTIEFDPTLGYPTRIERDGREPSEWGSQGIRSTMPAHSSYWKRVAKFTVIKHATPEIPDSGQPSR